MDEREMSLNQENIEGLGAVTPEPAGQQAEPDTTGEAGTKQDVIEEESQEKVAEVSTPDAGEVLQVAQTGDAEEPTDGATGNAEEPTDGATGNANEPTDGATRNTNEPTDGKSGDAEESTNGATGDAEESTNGATGDANEPTNGATGDANEPTDGKSGDAEEPTDGATGDAEEPTDSATGDGNGEPQKKPDATKRTYNSKKEVVDRIKEIAHAEDTPQKDEVEYLKTIFYKMHSAEREADQKAFIEGGGDPETYHIKPDEDEEAFKAEMGVIKERRTRIFLETEKKKHDNLNRKLEIIERIKAMVVSNEDVNKSLPEFRRLQQEWKEIRLVPMEKANELWRNYQLYVEKFYDLLKLNNESREYDFRKNLEAKTKICEDAERLAEDKDVINAFHRLQELHQKFREIGPVSKDLREGIWTRFKAASTVINKRHQKHFEELRSKEAENLAKKTELCDRVEAVVKDDAKSASEWERKTKEIIAIQAEWKAIGFAPQKMNVKIFERFRAACDDFFSRKAEYFRGMKQQFSENAERKKALVEQAQALMDSTDWKATGDKLIALQKEWKTIGMVPKKHGDKLWNEFLAACNHFFEARNKATSGTRGEERSNLEEKRALIRQLKDILEEGDDGAQDRVDEIIDQYNAVGHVPYREKDRLYKEYHDVLDGLYRELGITTSRRRNDRYRTGQASVSPKGEDAADNERMRLMRRYEALKQEIQTYENNLGFLNVSSKSGNSLIDEMNRKVDKLKEDLAQVRDKIKAIDLESAEE